ncbi:DedA family protein [Marinomonas balearica]|uniref:Membrane protein DedA with SNARE-associated domain n=1 Tax=Marinomonas balearica TaxID=491947 RepID=A0A4R6M3G5_9GAMM|nr:VTT domain-containing protein [Marinomonas balearica]TDO95783.1 membrane protein DedA with SNARE-associated domain [Marinomonas balearica]
MLVEWQTWIGAHADSVGFVFVGLLLLTYLLEDVAIVCAATLATQGLVNIPVALIAIFVGIVTGDMALYVLGRYGRRLRGLRYKTLTSRYFKYTRKKLVQRPFLNLFLIRFIPGLRTIGFTLSGFMALSPWLFLAAALVATSIWSVLIFTLLYYVGVAASEVFHEIKWLVPVIALSVLLFANLVLSKLLKRRYA